MSYVITCPSCSKDLAVPGAGETNCSCGQKIQIASHAEQNAQKIGEVVLDTGAWWLWAQIKALAFLAKVVFVIVLVILALMAIVMVSTVSSRGETNAPSILNAHERFYLTYRAQKTALRVALTKAEAQKQTAETAYKRQIEAGVPLQKINATDFHRLDRQVAQLKARDAQLDVARLQYEKKNPGAVQYAQTGPVMANMDRESPGKATPVIIVNTPRIQLVTTNQTSRR